MSYYSQPQEEYPQIVRQPSRPEIKYLPIDQTVRATWDDGSGTRYIDHLSIEECKKICDEDYMEFTSLSLNPNSTGDVSYYKIVWKGKTFTGQEFRTLLESFF
jgi:hypothetical protein